MEQKMEQKQAQTYLRGISKDYVDQLRKQGHHQAAEVVWANCVAALNALSTAESTQQIPDARDTD